MDIIKTITKIKIVTWCGEGAEKLKEIGFKPGQTIDGDPFDVAKKIFDIGLNVLLLRSSDGSIIVGVDTQRFQTR